MNEIGELSLLVNTTKGCKNDIYYFLRDSDQVRFVKFCFMSSNKLIDPCKKI